MTKKLLNIKLILRIIISLFVIVNVARSCAKAVTYETIHDYANDTADYYPNNSIYQTIKSIINNMPSDKIALVNSGGAEFNNFVIYKHSFQNKYYIEFYHSNNNKLNSNGTQISITSGYFQSIQYNNGWGNFNSSNTNISNRTISNGSTSSTTGQENSLSGMFYYEDEIVGTLPPTFVGIQAVNTNPLYFGHLFSSEVTIDGNSYQAVELNYNYRRTFVENVLGIEGYTSFSAKLDTVDLQYEDLGDYLVVAYPNSTLLNYNQVYLLHVEVSIEDNLYELDEEVIFVKPGTIISGGSIVSTPSGDFSFSTENATNQIIENQNQNNNEIVQSINNIVGNLPDLTSGDLSGDSSGDLSSGFDGGGGILGGIFSLFVPDGQFFKNYFDDLNNWFSDRLGLLYFPIELTIDFLTRCLNIDFTQQVLSIGPYVMPLNDNFELVPEIQIDFKSLLEDETVNSIHEVYLFITDGLIIFGLYRLILKKYNNIVKNKGGG